MTAILDILRAHRFSFTTELELQDGIATVLGALPGYSREEYLSATDRPDFMVGGTAVVPGWPVEASAPPRAPRTDDLGRERGVVPPPLEVAPG